MRIWIVPVLECDDSVAFFVHKPHPTAWHSWWATYRVKTEGGVLNLIEWGIYLPRIAMQLLCSEIGVEIPKWSEPPLVTELELKPEMICRFEGTIQPIDYVEYQNEKI